MNSVIIEGIYKLCSVIYGYIEKSFSYGVFMKIYGKISLWWKNSAIMTVLRTKTLNSKSYLSYIMHLPFSAFEAVNKGCSAFFRQSVANSVIARVAYGVIMGVFRLNTRFIGIIMAISGLICGAWSVYDSGGIVTGSIVFFAAAGIGVILMFLNINIMKYLCESFTFGFLNTWIKAFKSDKLYNCVSDVYMIAAAVIVGIVSGAAGVYNPLFAPVAAVGIFGVLWILKVPFVGVAVTIFIAPLAPTMVVVASAIYTTIAFLAKALVTPDFKFRFGKTGCGVMAFITILFITSLLSCSMKSSLMVWAMYFAFGIFFFTVLNAVENMEDVKTLFICFSVSALCVAVYGIMQYVFGWTTENAWIDETMFAGDTMRVYSTLGNPNVLGEYLLLALPITIVPVLFYDRKKLSKWFFAAVFLVLLGCLVLTQSRGCWLGFILAAVIFISFWEGKLWGLALAGLCLVPLIMPESIINRIASIGNMGDSSTSYRVFIWLGTLDMLKKYWMGGIGMGEDAFQLVYPKYSYSAIIAPHSHNVFLQLVVEGGIITLAIFIAMVFCFMRQLYTVYKANKDKYSFERIGSLALGAGMAAFLLQSMFDYSFYNYRVMGLFFMFMALGSAMFFLGRSAAAKESEGPIKVIQVSTDTNIGGAGKCLLTILSNYDREQFEMKVILPKNSLLKAEVEKTGTEVIEVDGIAEKSFSRGAIKDLKRIFKSEAPDIVHAHASMSARIAARRAGCKVVFTRHSVFEPSPKISKGIGKFINGTINNYYSDSIIAVAEAAKENIVKTGVDPGKITVILNGVDALTPASAEEKIKIRERFGVENGEKTVSIIARLEDIKGHLYFIDAAQRLNNEGINAKYFIAGTGSFEEVLKSEAEKLCLKNVVFTGFIKDVDKLLDITDVQANASYGTEATSLALLEGMSLGIPAVVSDFGGNPGVIADGENGFVVPKQNGKALAEGIQKLLTDDALYAKMSKRSTEIFNEQFTSSVMTRKTEELYKKTICRKDDLN